MYRGRYLATCNVINVATIKPSPWLLVPSCVIAFRRISIAWQISSDTNKKFVEKFKIRQRTRDHEKRLYDDVERSRRR